MESYFEVNVSLNGSHFFATAPRSGTNREHIARVVRALSTVFLPELGYEVTVTRWEGSGKTVSVSNLLRG